MWLILQGMVGCWMCVYLCGIMLVCMVKSVLIAFFTLFSPASADYQPKPEVIVHNNKTENGQTNVKER